MSSVQTPNTLAGKQRELHQRDEMHLEMAREIFLREGYHNLTISNLARATGFARPTLYERFHSKEELIFELGLRCQRELVTLLRQASAFVGRPRERMVSIGETFRYFTDRYANDLRISNFSGTEIVQERVSAALRRQHAELDTQIFEIVREIIDDAVREGDLVFRPGMSAQALTLTLVALIDGLALAIRGSIPLDEVGVTDPASDLFRNVHVLFDGYGWRPLYDEWDYEDTKRRIYATVISKMGAGAGS